MWGINVIKRHSMTHVKCFTPYVSSISTWSKDPWWHISLRLSMYLKCITRHVSCHSKGTCEVSTCIIERDTRGIDMCKTCDVWHLCVTRPMTHVKCVTQCVWSKDTCDLSARVMQTTHMQYWHASSKDTRWHMSSVQLDMCHGMTHVSMCHEITHVSSICVIEWLLWAIWHVWLRVMNPSALMWGISHLWLLRVTNESAVMSHCPSALAMHQLRCTNASVCCGVLLNHKSRWILWLLCTNASPLMSYHPSATMQTCSTSHTCVSYVTPIHRH